MESLIRRWRALTDEIVETWISTTFNIPDNEDVDWEWVNDDVSGIICFADYYIGFGDILECLKKDIPQEKFLEYYDWNLENYPKHINLNSFIVGAADIKQDELERLKEKVEIAQKGLERAIEKYISMCSCRVNSKIDGENYCRNCLNENPLLCT